MLSSLSLIVSAALGLQGKPTQTIPPNLRAHGWQHLDGAPGCAGLRAGSYFEAGNDEGTVELYALDDGGVLASRAVLPPAPYDCHLIPKPLFVEEIR